MGSAIVILTIHDKAKSSPSGNQKQQTQATKDRHVDDIA